MYINTLHTCKIDTLATKEKKQQNKKKKKKRKKTRFIEENHRNWPRLSRDLSQYFSPPFYPVSAPIYRSLFEEIEPLSVNWVTFSRDWLPFNEHRFNPLSRPSRSRSSRRVRDKSREESNPLKFPKTRNKDLVTGSFRGFEWPRRRRVGGSFFFGEFRTRKKKEGEGRGRKRRPIAEDACNCAIA